jgi:hypothetical protein
MPKVSEEEVLLSQTLKVVYTNSLTSGESIYQFKYSRMTANTPFKFDSIVKV